MIYLASRSPRRAELLRQIGVDFVVHDVDIDESRLPAEAAGEYVCRMASTKARIAAGQIVDELVATGRQESCAVLAADTTIALDDDIIGKPADRDQCRCILQRLSARQHQVLTAVALATAGDIAVRLTRNRVSFKPLSTAEIEAYCATAEPMDKAGAYAIQGKAALFIDHLEGSYSAVMGLPLFETAELLRNADIELF
jgi:septum formation protein